MERIVVVYERVSTDRQDLSRQAVQRERAAADHPDAALRVIQDDGVSAYKVPIFDRPGGRELCGLIATGTVGAVYADAQDRLSRGKLAEWVNFKALCDDNGTRIVIDGRELRADDESDEMMAAFAAMSARRESAEKSHRVRGGKRRQAGGGRYLSSTRPYGYDLVGGRLLVNAAEAAVVERMADWYESGLGYRQIAARLNAEATPSARGGGWQESTVRKLISSPRIAGYIVHRGEALPGAHDAIIEPERWHALQEARQRRRPTGQRPNGGHVFVAGMLRCPGCAAALRPRTSRTGYAYYECRGADSGDCSQGRINAREIEGQILARLVQLVFDPEQTRAAIEAEAARERDRASQLMAEAERGMRAVARKRERVENDYLDSKLSADQYQRFLEKLDAEQEQVRARADELREAAAAAEALASDVDAEREAVARLKALQAVIAGARHDATLVGRLREALGALFARIDLYPDARNPGGLLVHARGHVPGLAVGMGGRVVADHPDFRFGQVATEPPTAQAADAGSSINDPR